MKVEKILLADDDENILWVLEKFFADKGLPVVKTKDGGTAASLLKKGGFALALLDINMPGRDGLEILKDCSGAKNPVAIIVMTGEDTLENALEAMKRGAFDYITKPFDLDELDIIVRKALESVRLKLRVTSLEERLKKRWTDETVFVGKSRAVKEVFKTVGRVAPRDVTVLIQGESGTGKEFLARLIHANSPRCDGPFIAVNSAAVPGDLMESELFGYEKGAFTGAVERRAGKFELADEGTLFLDEIGDMTLDLQAKLLRALQEKEFYRVGGREPVKVDVRIIAATNQDLEKAVEERRFREDLLYRLNVITITLPPLRDREGDVRLLADYFLDRFQHEMGVERKGLSEGALAMLERYHWPGNVRELENVLRRAVLMTRGMVLTEEDLDLPKRRKRSGSLEEIITARLRHLVERTAGTGGQELYSLVMPYMERPLIKLVLEKTKGNQVQAAELLGINRNTLRKKIKELKIRIEDFKGQE